MIRFKKISELTPFRRLARLPLLMGALALSTACAPTSTGGSSQLTLEPVRLR